MLHILTKTLFGKVITKKYLKFMNSNYEKPISYKKEWSMYSFWNKYEILITKHNLKLIKEESHIDKN